MLWNGKRLATEIPLRSVWTKMAAPLQAHLPEQSPTSAASNLPKSPCLGPRMPSNWSQAFLSECNSTPKQRGRSFTVNNQHQETVGSDVDQRPRILILVIADRIIKGPGQQD
jgi:hypothetical protein